MSKEKVGDPRDLLVHQKYYSLRPRPLEQWLWRRGVPASAERVFWLHWQEGMIHRDWCSEIPLKRVATQCDVDISSVTRAYQLLGRLGLIRRQDPGRDPTRPFERAVAITEVRIPAELLQELNRHPDRTQQQRAPASSICAAETRSAIPESSENHVSTAPSDPFEGMSGRARMRALAELVRLMSAPERRCYDTALRTGGTQMKFDADSRLTMEQQGRVWLFLAIVAPTQTIPMAASTKTAERETTPGPRRLSVFELARIRRDIQQASVQADSAELLREVVWSVEEGALRRFSTLHASRIALKKIREGAWTRPNRMPPNWSRALIHANLSHRASAQIDTCRTA